MQDINANQLKLKVNDNFKNDDKKATNFEPSDDEDLVNKGYLNTKVSKIVCHLSNRKKNNNEIKVLSNKQSQEEVLIEQAVKTTTQIVYDKELFDIYDNADEVLKDYLLFENNERRNPDLEELKIVIQ